MNPLQARRTALAATLLTGLLAADAAAQVPIAPGRLRLPQVTNLQLAVGDLALDGDLVAFAVREGQQGKTDLNGDGDSADEVLHVHDLSTGATTNLGLAIDLFAGLVVDGRRVAFAVDESDQGGVDRNGDGDADDQVCGLYDADTGTLQNLALAAAVVRLRGDLVALHVLEGQQGLTDFNGDGDFNDPVLFAHDIGTGVTSNTGRAVQESVVAAGYIGFDVPEDDQGFTDLNGDGDTSDFVVHVYTAATQTSKNLGLPGNSPLFAAGERLFAFTVRELDHGGADLNGDGDVLDGNVLHLHDAATGTTANLAVDVGFDRPSVLGDRVAFLVDESDQGNTVLNGDGDVLDEVLHLFDASTGVTTNLGYAAESGLVANADLLAFRVRESAQGGVDLNGDGDTADLGVVHVHVLATGITSNVQLEGASVAIDGGRVAFLVREAGQGAADRNGDGDAADNVVHVFDVGAGAARNLRLAGSNLAFADGFLGFVVQELGQGQQDLNGDGDTFDQVVFEHDASTGATFGLRLAHNLPPLLRGHGLAFLCTESGQGFTDLNGDGDDGDQVLHVVVWR